MKIVVLSGAGISAESGIPTFRGSDGLWEGHDIAEVASPQGWAKNPALVLDFYNQRRKNMLGAKPNDGHQALALLEQYFDVTIITQNIDNLHEQGGSTQVLHLHGEIFKSRSTLDPNLVYDMDGWEINLGDLCEKGAQLRPHIVWFGEMVPAIQEAAEIASSADIFIVVGTSMAVYPAAGLIDFVPDQAMIYVIDPIIPSLTYRKNLQAIETSAAKGLPTLAHDLIRRYAS